MLFSDEFIEKLKRIPYPNTKYQALVKLLKRAIKEFGKTNRLKAIEFSKKLKNVIDRYNSRNTISDVEDIIEDVVDNLSEELEKIFSDLKKEKQSFEAMDITYEEKAFYDILIAVAEKYGFKDQLAEDTYIFLAKEIQKLVGNKSKYTDWTNRQDVKDVLATGRAQAKVLQADALKEKWYCAIPVVLIWALVGCCILRALLR